MGKIFIIAEAGVNHNGSLKRALKMIDAAAAAGADAVKFQTFRAESLVSRYAPKAEYQKKSTGAGESQLEMLKKLELGPDEFAALLAHCKKRRIVFLSSPFDTESVRRLNSKGMKIFKIPSGEITNLPYLRMIGRLGKKVILSTGMSGLAEIRNAVGVLTGCGTKRANITLLHCNTEYPTPMMDVNLKAMVTLREKFKLKTGYSDHTQGIEVAVAAAALGASVIEKHFTLDKKLPGPDHKASLEPAELGAMVKAVRNIEAAIGDGVKRPSPSETKNIRIARKSIVALKGIKKGEIFSETNMTAKRPGTGISPMKWDSVAGRRAARDFSKDEQITL